MAKVDEADLAAESSGGRLAPRRRTRADVRIISGVPNTPLKAVLTDLSGDGAFIRHQPILERGTRLELEILLPALPPLRATARVVRTGRHGCGVRFEEMTARHRAALRHHATFGEMDDAVKRVQRFLDIESRTPFLPLGDQDEIRVTLSEVIAKGVEVDLVDLVQDKLRARAKIHAFDLEHITLGDVTPPLATAPRVLYVAFRHDALTYVFEGLIDGFPRMLLPQRLYFNERRASRRLKVEHTHLVLEAEHVQSGALVFEVLELSEEGAAIAGPPGVPWTAGMRLPELRLTSQGGSVRSVPGAQVRYVRPLQGRCRIGLRFEAESKPTDEPPALEPSQIETGFGALLKLGIKRPRIRDVATADAPHVANFKNNAGEAVVGLVDATFDPDDPGTMSDLAVVIAPGFPRRKESWSLLAKSIAANAGARDLTVAVVRYDGTHALGESAKDPDLVGRGTPSMRWRLGAVADDLIGAVQWTRKRFQPRKLVIVTPSMAALAARRLLADDATFADAWIAPFGWPDAREPLERVLAGRDVFATHLDGPITLLGAVVDAGLIAKDAQERRLVSLDDARADFARIGVPTIWITGSNDAWVDRARVRELFDAGGGATREIFEVPSGHMVARGDEVLELCKVITESALKYGLSVDAPAADPDVHAFARSSEREWQRLRRSSVGDVATFWRHHLFGPNYVVGGEASYDVLLHNPDYVGFMQVQAELLGDVSGQDFADFGCGTGNLALELVRRAVPTALPRSVTLVDLIPDALAASQRKLRELLREHRLDDGRVRISTTSADLEVNRLNALNELLTGELYSVEALAGRIDNLPATLVEKLASHYGPELHAILRGTPTARDRIASLVPGLSEDEVEMVVELGRAARFLRGTLEPTDQRSSLPPRTTADLRFHKLDFGASGRDMRLAIPDGNYDSIGCSLLVSFIADPLTLLRELHRALRPGGTLVVSSLLPSFEPSATQQRQVENIRARVREPERAEALLEATRTFGAHLARVLELRDEGRFSFLSGTQLRDVVTRAGFVEVDGFPAWGEPACAAVVRGRKAKA